MMISSLILCTIHVDLGPTMVFLTYYNTVYFPHLLCVPYMLTRFIMISSLIVCSIHTCWYWVHNNFLTYCVDLGVVMFSTLIVYRKLRRTR